MNPADPAPPIERTFRHAYMLETPGGDDPIRGGRGDEMDQPVNTARELQDPLLGGASD